MENIIPQNQNPNQNVMDTGNKQNTPLVEDKEEVLMDFSSMFKKNGFAKKPMPKLGANRKTQTQSPNWLLQIPTRIDLNMSDLQQRRYMNEEKWRSMTKTPLSSDQSLAALVSSVNFLIKQNAPQSQIPLVRLRQLKESLITKGVLCESTSRRQTLLKSLSLLEQRFKTECIKAEVHQMTEESKEQEFLELVLTSLKDRTKAFVYICYGQSLCPIGFENTPLVPLDAYKKLEEIDPTKMEMWIISASPNKNQTPFVIKRWSDILKELRTKWPEYLDLDQTKKGIQKYEPESQKPLPQNIEKSCWIQLTFKTN